MEDATARVVGDEVLHDDARDVRADLGQHVDHEVVRERALARDARDPRRDAVRLVGPDPDRQEPVRALGLEKDDVLIGQDVDPDRLDRARHEHLLQSLAPAPQGPCRCHVSQSYRNRLASRCWRKRNSRSTPATKPKTWAK